MVQPYHKTSAISVRFVVFYFIGKSILLFAFLLLTAKIHNLLKQSVLLPNLLLNPHFKNICPSTVAFMTAMKQSNI